MTISANYPAIRPSLLLDFANTKALDPRITFSRPTTATYYDNHTTVVAEQNLFTRSQEFDSADWGKTATAVTANSTVAPDGTTTADTVTADGTTGSKTISGSNMGTVAAPATARTVSVYAKAGTNNFLQIYFSGDATPWADFDLSAGTVGSTGSNQTASIVSVGSGWYRCVLYTASTTATTCNFCIVSSSTAARAESNSLATTVILWGAQLEQRSSVTAYTATTTAPITNYIPVLQTATSGQARFDHNPTTGESLGLLIEEQRTNLQTYSSDYTNAIWAKGNVTVTSTAGIAPDGTQTAQTITESTAASSQFYVQNSINISASTAYSCSFYVKRAAGTRNFYIQVNTSGGTTGAGFAWFDLGAGTTQAATTLSGTFVAGTPTITSVGNGWYRCTLPFTSNVGNTAFVSYVGLYNANRVYTGDGWSALYIWGSQYEAGSFATSYIPTVASQVTRSADSASMTGTNFSSWYNNAEGSIYTDAVVPTASYISAISDGTANNYIVNRYNSSGTSAIVTTGGTIQANYGSPTLSGKNASTYKVNDFASSVNGASPATDTSGSIPTVNQLQIGSFLSGNYANGTIKKLAYYPIRVTNTQLQALTGS